MSSVVLKGNASGNGVITLETPNTNSDLTISMPASAGTMMVSGNMPAFSAYANTSQTVSSGTFTKVNFSVEDFDTNNNFASSRFTPTVAGYYQININGWYQASTVTRAIISMYKNGSSLQRFFDLGGTVTAQLGTSGSIIIYLNGSTDYVEAYIWMTGTGTLSVSSSTFGETFRITGCLVRAA
jgi:hypothetical protein